MKKACAASKMANMPCGGDFTSKKRIPNSETAISLKDAAKVWRTL